MLHPDTWISINIHPGSILKEDVFGPARLSVENAAQLLSNLQEDENL